ncbi:MAG: TfoX/Sxy family protein [Myxococcota bacterium]
MAYDEKLAERVRSALSRRRGVTERKMFGGLSFMVNGHMCCGVVGDDLMVRVGPDRYDKALARKGVREMNFTGRPMKGMVFIDQSGYQRKSNLESWIDQGLKYARSLPPKG